MPANSLTRVSLSLPTHVYFFGLFVCLFPMLCDDGDADAPLRLMVADHLNDKYTHTHGHTHTHTHTPGTRPPARPQRWSTSLRRGRRASSSSRCRG